MKFKPGGIEYFKNMTRGYISYFRGDDPITFANKIEIGQKPKGLIFTKLTKCYMEQFQLDAYNETMKTSETGIDKKSEAIANFVFPILDSSGVKTKIVGTSGREGLNILKGQLKSNHDKINKLIGELLGIEKYHEEFINFNETTKNITGAILKKEFLKTFSTKFYQSLIDVEDTLFYKNEVKESRTGFVYSNLVKIGIEIYKEILIINGWLEFDENVNNYKIKDDTICYYCGLTHKEHKGNKENNKENNKAEFVKFASPLNKLKVAKKTTESALKQAKSAREYYSIEKGLSIIYVNALLDNDTEKELLSNAIAKNDNKGDDICDSYLQGFHHIFNGEIPEYYQQQIQNISADKLEVKNIKSKKKVKDISV